VRAHRILKDVQEAPLWLTAVPDGQFSEVLPVLPLHNVPSPYQLHPAICGVQPHHMPADAVVSPGITRKAHLYVDQLSSEPIVNERCGNSNLAIMADHLITSKQSRTGNK
jgi:hypothetical protein